MSKEAMKLALEALDGIYRYGLDTLSGRSDGLDDRDWQRAGVNEMTKRARFGITALKALAEQPAQRPIKTFHDGKAWPVQEQAQQEPFGFAVMENPIAPPAQRTWVGLTDKEIGVLWFEANDQDNSMIKHFARAIEAKLKEKNT